MRGQDTDDDWISDEDPIYIRIPGTDIDSYTAASLISNQNPKYKHVSFILILSLIGHAIANSHTQATSISE